MEVVDPNPSPSEWCAEQELLQELRRRMSDDERRLVDCRAEGRDWEAISAELGGTPDGRRMQLTRALDRIAVQLGVDDGDRSSD